MNFEGTSDYTYDDYRNGIYLLAEKIKDFKPDYVCGISRGGLVPAVEISYKNNIPLVTLDPRSIYSVNSLHRLLTSETISVIMVDEICDSGATVKKVHDLFEKEFQWAFLVYNISQTVIKNPIYHYAINRNNDKRYFNFHWDRKNIHETEK